MATSWRGPSPKTVMVVEMDPAVPSNPAISEGTTTPPGRLNSISPEKSSSKTPFSSSKLMVIEISSPLSMVSGADGRSGGKINSTVFGCRYWDKPILSISMVPND